MSEKEAVRPVPVVRDGGDGGFFRVPTLFRFVMIIAAAVGLVYGAMIALVVLVQPHPREMEITVPKAVFKAAEVSPTGAGDDGD